jgi:hypothetical protein
MVKRDARDVPEVHVPADELRAFTASLFTAAGTSDADAHIMATLLVQNDLLGSYMHGTPACGGLGWQEYVGKMLDGGVNPRPAIRVVSESGTTRVYDGDGGLGHIACHAAVTWAVATAKAHGSAVVTTRNHYHFGAAGTWTRLALEQDCVAIAVSSHRYQQKGGGMLDPAASIKAVNAVRPAPPARAPRQLVRCCAARWSCSCMGLLQGVMYTGLSDFHRHPRRPRRSHRSRYGSRAWTAIRGG